MLYKLVVLRAENMLRNTNYILKVDCLPGNEIFSICYFKLMFSKHLLPFPEDSDLRHPGPKPSKS